MEVRLRECHPSRTPVGVALAAGCASAFVPLRDAGASLSMGTKECPLVTVGRNICKHKSQLVGLLLEAGKSRLQRCATQMVKPGDRMHQLLFLSLWMLDAKHGMLW